MTQIAVPLGNTIKLNIDAEGGIHAFGIIMIEEGGGSGFPCLYLTDEAGVTYYYWPTATTGALRYGTSAPTVATRGSAGGAV